MLSASPTKLGTNINAKSELSLNGGVLTQASAQMPQKMERATEAA